MDRLKSMRRGSTSSTSPAPQRRPASRQAVVAKYMHDVITPSIYDKSIAVEPMNRVEPGPAMKELTKVWAGKDRHARPVWIRCTVTNLYGVNVQDQTFKAYIKFEAKFWPLSDDDFGILQGLYEKHGELKDRWINSERTKGRFASAIYLEEETGVHKEILGPRINFVNCIEKEAVDMDEFTISGWRPDNPCLRWNCFFVGTFQEPMELRLFPIDKQPLKICVQTGFSLRKQPVWLLKNPEKPSIVVHQRFVQANQYKLNNELFFAETVSDPSESSEELVFSRLEITMCVYRKPWFWFFQVILPNFLITITMLASYAEDYENLEGRCGITITVLLALVAFRYVISDRTPEISYSTLMDHYMLASMVFALVIIASQTMAKLGLSDLERMKWTFNVSIAEAMVLGSGADYQVGDTSIRTIALPVPMCVALIVWTCYHLLILVVMVTHGFRPWTSCEDGRLQQQKATEGLAKQAAEAAEAATKTEKGARARGLHGGHSGELDELSAISERRFDQSDRSLAPSGRSLPPSGRSLSPERSEWTATLSVASPSEALKEPRQASRLRATANGMAHLSPLVAEPTSRPPLPTESKSPPRWVMDPQGYTPRDPSATLQDHADDLTVAVPRTRGLRATHATAPASARWPLSGPPLRRRQEQQQRQRQVQQQRISESSDETVQFRL